MAQTSLRLFLSRSCIASLGNAEGAKALLASKGGGALLPSSRDNLWGYLLSRSSHNASIIRAMRWAEDGPGFCRLQSPVRLFGTASADYVLAVDDVSMENSSRTSSTLHSAENSVKISRVVKPRSKGNRKKSAVDFTKVDAKLLPTVMIVGRPNVGKSALFNRLIRRREALVYNTPDDHLGDLRFRVLDSAGLETAASSGSILDRTADLTGSVLARTQFAIFLIDVRAGLQPLDVEVGNWLRKNASGVRTILAMNKSESLDDGGGLLIAEAAEAHVLGFGDPIAISAETGLGMAELYETLCPLLEDYMLQQMNDQTIEEEKAVETEENKLPLQLAIVGRPNVGKSTLLNTLLREKRVLVGPEAGLTRDSVRAQFNFEGRTIYLVDTAGWLQRCGQEKGPASLSVMQSRKNLMRANVVALVLDAEEIANKRCSMKHAEVAIARQAVEEGRGLVVIVNKMDLLRGKQNMVLHDRVIDAVPKEIRAVIPQVTGVPVVFVSALEGEGRIPLLDQIVDTYEKWCLRLPTARLNRWLRKVMSRHSWKDQATKPKIKYFTQVKARPPTFVAFKNGETQLSDSYVRFLTKSLRTVPTRSGGGSSKPSKGLSPRAPARVFSDKRSVI
ncbi:unnamed protein product [Spirodela intermedia]|uniref:GTPase Der n=1 Tax=Spirodela intermedia TaxID=51605 RepID=A0A7I8J7A5_SPIIN|nr:unnamed protein product [Spirodela intermedia]CAA6665959.1 unnamed protein product [Spirodela intermedia]